MIIPAHYLELFEPLDGVTTILDFGNKRGINSVPYRKHWHAAGVEYTSVDLNGLDGALPLDLRKPLELGTFDLVSNVGTIEHVDDQEPAWRNLVEAAHHLIISISPLPGHWPGHGLWYPSWKFYRDLAAGNAFYLERLYTAGPAGRSFTYARLRRLDRVPFVMPVGGLLRAPPRGQKAKR